MRSTSGAALSPHVRPREPLAATMQAFYQMPFEPFERYSPYGTREQVAEFLRPSIMAGGPVFSVVPCANDVETAIGAVGEFGRCSRRPEASWWSETQLAGALDRVSR